MRVIELLVPMKLRRYLLMLSGDKRWYVTKIIPNEYARMTTMKCRVYVSDHRFGYEGLFGYVCASFTTKRIICLKWMGDDWEKREETDGWNAGFTKGELKKLRGKDLWLWEMTNEEVYSNPKELSEFGRETPPTTWAYLGEENK